MRHSHAPLFRLLCSSALIALLMASSGCTQLSALFGKKSADTGSGDDPGTDDVDQTTDDGDATDDVDDVVDVPDVKKDVPDVKKTDTKDTGPDTPDVQDDQTDEDATDLDTTDDDSQDDATDLTDVAADVDTGPDVKVDVDTGPDVQPDIDTSVDTGINPVGCKVDADCGAVPASSCAAKFLCLVDAGTQVGTCVATNAAENGTACDDNNKCTTADVCNNGSCAGTALDCEDGNACTIDSCVSVTGKCKHDTSKAGSICTDGDSCTVGDACAQGVCVPGTNACDCKADADCAVQDSPNVCDGKHVCQSNVCVLDATTVVTCTDPGVACQLNLCDPTTGKCGIVFRGNGSSCTDNNLCTFPDLCQDGACASTPLVCNDGNPCTDDSCVANKPLNNGGGCQYTNNTAPCDDGDLCTGDGVCGNGACTKGALNPAACACAVDADCAGYNSNCGGQFHCNASNKCVVDATTVVTCSPAGNTACQTNTCDETTGKCKFVPNDSTTPCDDNNICTTGDHCDGAGKCIKTSTFNCNDGNACTTDYCVPTAGCKNPFNALTCDDGNACTVTDVCTLGKCVGSPYDGAGNLVCACQVDADCAKLDVNNKCQAPHVCSSAKSCQFSGTAPPDPCASVTKSPCRTYSCNASTGACDSPPKTDGIQCNDGNWCTQNDACAGGTCTGPTNSCDDGNDCTTDAACDPKLGSAGCSSHTAVDDGSGCTLNDKCQLFPACASGVCTGTPPNCDDANPCTVDSCDSKVGCKHTSATNGTACSDGNPCTGEDAKLPDGSVNIGQDGCVMGKCVAAKAKDCKVANTGPCYTSTCDPTSKSLDSLTQKYACIQAMNNNPCQGGDACIVNQSCSNGFCQGGNPKNCDDGNICTDDSCWNLTIDPLTPPGTCINGPLGGLPCDDGSLCTVKDACNGATCGGKAISYDDGNPCTLDSCDAKTGLIHTNDPNGNCGPLAKCNNDAVPSCVFASKPLLISEFYIGVPGDPSDDWVEIHNPTNNDVPIPSYAIEVAEAKPDVGVGWTKLADTGTSGLITAHGYLLFGHSATVSGGQAPDIVSATLDFKHATQVDLKGAPILDVNSLPITISVGQVRLRDGVTGLVHDRLCLDAGGCTDLGVDITPVTLSKATANSLERKADSSSTADSMAYHHPQWLAGNDYTDGLMPNDNYVFRLTPDPQTHKSAVYEPACGGTCDEAPVPMMCNYNPAAEACVPDLKCSVGCGSGKTCNADVNACIPNQPGVLFSEILPGGQLISDQQFIEIYNAGATAIDVSGFVIQTKTATAAYTDPWVNAYQLPAGATLPSHRYYAIGTASYALTAGGLDALVSGLGLDPAGAAVRLWDPRTDVELDTVGWGTALSFTNGSNSKYLAAASVTPGNSLERKSDPVDYADTMKPGGLHSLAGNAIDTDHDDQDWIEQDVTGAQSFASGQFEPACGGSCSLGFDCPFTGTDGGKCADPTCGGICNVQSATTGGGFACNIALATPACDASGLVIAEVSPQGPDSTTMSNAKLAGANNEYILLYNRANQDIVLDNLYITYRYTTAGSLPKATDADPTKKPLTGVIHAHSYFLITPSTYDSKIPGPDFVSSLTWTLYPDTGVVRLNRYDTAGQAVVLDRVSWGASTAMWSFGEGKGAAACPDATSPCAIRRLPLAGLSADDVTSPFSPWYYAGAGWDTNSNIDNFVTTTIRTPHNTCLQPAGTCPAKSPGVPQRP